MHHCSLNIRRRVSDAFLMILLIVFGRRLASFWFHFGICVRCFFGYVFLVCCVNVFGPTTPVFCRCRFLLFLIACFAVSDGPSGQNKYVHEIRVKPVLFVFIIVFWDARDSDFDRNLHFEATFFFRRASASERFLFDRLLANVGAVFSSILALVSSIFRYACSMSFFDRCLVHFGTIVAPLLLIFRYFRASHFASNKSSNKQNRKINRS